MDVATALQALAVSGTAAFLSGPLFLVAVSLRRKDVEDALPDLSRRMLAHVRRQPGVSLSELRERMGLAWGTFYHHLRKLRDAGLIALRATGRRRSVLPVGVDHDEEVARRAAALRGRTARRIASIVAREPGASIAHVQREAGVTTRSAYYHLRRLVDAGLVAQEGGGYGLLRPTPDLLRLLAHDAGETEEEETGEADDAGGEGGAPPR